MGILIDDAFNKNLISKEYYNRVPKKCICGNMYKLSESLRYMYCDNNECKCHVINRIVLMFEQAGFSISSKDVKIIVEKANIISPYQMLMINDAIEAGLIDKDECFELYNIQQYIKVINQKEYNIPQIIKLCGIKNISTVADAIASGFESMDELFNEIKIGEVGFISDRLGIENEDASILSYIIYNELQGIKNELMLAESLLKVHTSNKIRLKVAFTKSSGRFLNKREMIEYLNAKYENIEFIHISSISEDTDILIRQMGESSYKNKQASRINDNYAAKLVNNHEIKIDEINKEVDEQLKPTGCIIYECTVNELENKLNSILGDE